MVSSSSFSCEVRSAEQMEALGFATKQAISNGARIYLTGQLAAGKTVFCRGYLRCAGYSGKVKSPTFTIIESYSLSDIDIHHFDLYRIEDPIELDFIGLDQYFQSGNHMLVEWSVNGEGRLPVPDLDVEIVMGTEPNRRDINMVAKSELGLIVVTRLSKAF